LKMVVFEVDPVSHKIFQTHVLTPSGYTISEFWRKFVDAYVFDFSAKRSFDTSETKKLFNAVLANSTVPSERPPVASGEAVKAIYFCPEDLVAPFEDAVRRSGRHFKSIFMGELEVMAVDDITRKPGAASTVLEFLRRCFKGEAKSPRKVYLRNSTPEPVLTWEGPYI